MIERIRTSEILGVRVIDRDGQHVGKVHDIRVKRDGPVIGQFGPAYRVRTLIVGAAAVGARLGYGTGDVKGPWLVQRLFRRMHGDGVMVDWSLIASRSSSEIRINVPRSELPRVTPR
jgi:hypothetical protein